MSRLPGDRPERERNFHGTRGEHVFPHPEQYEPRRSAWSAWERRYAAHLDRHQELLRNPEPQDGDSQVVLDLFAHIACLEQIIAKEKLLIRTLRERDAMPAADHDERGLDELRRVLKGDLS